MFPHREDRIVDGFFKYIKYIFSGNLTNLNLEEHLDQIIEVIKIEAKKEDYTIFFEHKWNDSEKFLDTHIFTGSGRYNEEMTTQNVLNKMVHDSAPTYIELQFGFCIKYNL
ncbi:UNVERIFIED_CONTAM: hypothetical protein RMT77_014224 [Armadillidium vulgare]